MYNAINLLAVEVYVHVKPIILHKCTIHIFGSCPGAHLERCMYHISLHPNRCEPLFSFILSYGVALQNIAALHCNVDQEILNCFDESKIVMPG